VLLHKLHTILTVTLNRVLYCTLCTNYCYYTFLTFLLLANSKSSQKHKQFLKLARGRIPGTKTTQTDSLKGQHQHMTPVMLNKYNKSNFGSSHEGIIC